MDHGRPREALRPSDIAHSIEEVYTDKVHITGDSQFVRFEARGTVSCELQWGSNSDIRRGGGATLETSFPFVCALFSPVDDPSDVEAETDTFGVDTGSWRDRRDPGTTDSGQTAATMRLIDHKVFTQ